MAINIHPEIGTIVICDFTSFISPEMTKRRPAIIISPRFRERGELCTVLPLSTSQPPTRMKYHHKLLISPPLPPPYDAEFHWVKADMIYTVSFARLYLPFSKKDGQGKRIYDVRVLDKEELTKVQQCLLHGLGLSTLTE